MSKVYIVNKAGHDFSKAEKYGELVAVTSGVMGISPGWAWRQGMAHSTVK